MYEVIRSRHYSYRLVATRRMTARAADTTISAEHLNTPGFDYTSLGAHYKLSGQVTGLCNGEANSRQVFLQVGTGDRKGTPKLRERLSTCRP